MGRARPAIRRDSLAAWLLSFTATGEPALTIRQLMLLMTVAWTLGPHTVATLARRLRVDKGVITKTVDRLIQFGLARRIRDQHDRRVVFIHATDAGRTFLEEEHF